jgi:hypothetical protein
LAVLFSFEVLHQTTMSKKKKGKVVQLTPNQQSPENYIKTQARNLPIAECLISEKWKDSGICNILIARRHKNGNSTLGVYLLDLYCLGLKNCTYHFNVPPYEYDFIKSNIGNYDECDYALAHNIIYGGIAFAEDYGFKPDDDFKITQFILEEDDERVELIEVEFGLDGRPCYVRGPNDDAATVGRIKATLLRTAGEGNFSVAEFDENDFEDDDFDDEDWDDEEFEDDEQEDMGETMEELLKALKLTSKVYEKLFRTPEIIEIVKQSTMGKRYRLSEDGIKMDQNTFDNVVQESQYQKLLETFNNSEFEKAIKGLKKAIVQYDDKPQFYTLLQACYYFTEKTYQLEALVIDMYLRFPYYLYAKVPYANLLIDNGRSEGVLEVFDGKPDLNYIYPHRKTFHTHEAAVFLATMCRYFVAEDEIESADFYMDAILKKKLWNITAETLVRKAMIELYHAKAARIREHLGM